MSISYKKINSLIDQVLDEEIPNEEFRALSNEQKLTLRKLCKEVYMLESSPGNEFSSSQILSDIKGKINLSSDKIVGG
ncbi:hypothetical protein [Alteromonas australica]|jgi:hypothetical protein|uniref:hypothetical protein n=1 Tax=Alteromonas australica TaxID=589873 RepID=UPI0023559656|nr:hypothetical protein [Alteromonas australica]|tara:strand:- start:377 stop:610 length:234 start_codon:yes stop_codon:yes gene_type:complete